MFIGKGQSSEGSWGIHFHAWCTCCVVEFCYLLLQRHQSVNVVGEVEFYYWFNVAFTIFFALEAILKIIAFTPSVSYYQPWPFHDLPTSHKQCNVQCNAWCGKLWGQTTKPIHCQCRSNCNPFVTFVCCHLNSKLSTPAYLLVNVLCAMGTVGLGINHNIYLYSVGLQSDQLIIDNTCYTSAGECTQ